MLMEFTFGNTKCFLLFFCEANSTYSCTDEPDCLMAGPVTPSMVDSCYGRFKFWAIKLTKKCAWMNLIVLCYSLYWDVCFFTNVCGTPLVNSLRFLSRQIMTFCWLWQGYSFCSSGLPWHDHEHMWVISGEELSFQKGAIQWIVSQEERWRYWWSDGVFKHTQHQMEPSSCWRHSEWRWLCKKNWGCSIVRIDSLLSWRLLSQCWT